MGRDRKLISAHVTLSKTLAALTGKSYKRARKQVREAALGVPKGDRDVRAVKMGGREVEVRKDPEIL